ncbi:protein far1-related sequence 7 [Phtheirospermum japonicum]|uniref:Protein far1-related sequence 7 n=1 Tax=Phtheirospermum japonicum TaxID=374723 RepID=A0A830CAB5_9LAMI|nr:protein far1-related sequence 7 [Phtheirospermum japonicum]
MVGQSPPPPSNPANGGSEIEGGDVTTVGWLDILRFLSSFFVALLATMVEEKDVDLGQRDSNNVSETGGAKILEPYVGMEFESEDDARKYYTDYATRVGFVVRLLQPRRSETDGGTLTRCLVCNKHGLSLSLSPKGGSGPERKTRPSARDGCSATIHFKRGDSGKWVVTRLQKDHNHPLDLDLTAHTYINLRDKDKKIHELTGELQRQEEQFAAYRETFLSLVADIEKQADRHLSPKVLAVVQSVRKAEAEALVISKA